MQEPASRLFTDSILTEPFSTRPLSLLNSSSLGRSSHMWFVGPGIALVIVALIIGMLILWWFRCSRKSLFRHGIGGGGLANAGGSTTKVALSSAEFHNGNGVPTETSKLLLGMDSEGRPIMNSYEVYLF